MIKTSQFFYLVGACLIIIGLGYHFKDSEVHLWEEINSSYQIKGTSDQEGGGDSEVIAWKQSPQGLSFTYILSKVKRWAYAGINIEYTPKNQPKNCVDLSGYDAIRMELKSNLNHGLTFQLATFPKDIKEQETTRILHQVIKVDSTYQQYHLNLSHFFIPEWYKLNNNLPASGADMSLDCVQSVYLISSNYMERGVQDEIWWKNAYLIKSRTWTLPLALGVSLTSLLFLLIIYIKQTTWEKAVKNNILNKYNSKASQNPTELGISSEWELVREYFANHYSDADFKISEVAKKLKIPQKRLSSIIQDQIKQSPREYLNELRLKEGARLLKETPLAINQIAYDVGYNNTAHFNRQFKSKFSQTPKEYRSIQEQ